MHNNIFQVSKTPFSDEDGYLCEEDFFDADGSSLGSFIGWIADSVSDVSEKERREAAEVLLATFSDHDEKELSFVVGEGEKREYFTNRLKALRFYVNSLDPEDFIPENFPHHTVQGYTGDPYGIYVYEDGKGLQVFSDWLSDAEEGARYYIGGVIGYHA